MKTTLILSFAMLAAQVVRAESPSEEVAAAAKKLGESASYAWKSTTTVPEGARFRAGPTEGATEKDGCILLKTTMGDQTTETVIKAGKVAVKTEEGWKSGAELQANRQPGGGGGGGGGGGAGGGGRGRGFGGGGFAARMAESFKAPADEVEALVKGVKELKKEGDVISGDLTADALKERLSFGGRRGPRPGSEGTDRPAPPEPKDAKGSVKIWIKDGVIAKYELDLEGKITFGENEMDLKRTTTTEIKDVGTAKLEVPAEAKAKLEAAKTETPKPETPKPAEPAK